jgi:hypothetical protein
MKSHEYRKAQLDCYCKENDYFLQKIEAAHKNLNPVSQSVEESKTAQRVKESKTAQRVKESKTAQRVKESKTAQHTIKDIRFSKKVVETKSSFFGGPKTF